MISYYIFPGLSIGTPTVRKNSLSWTRTNDTAVNSRVLYRLSYQGILGILYSTIYPQNHILLYIFIRSSTPRLFNRSLIPYWISPRPISNSQLHMLPCFHLCPIYLVVFKGSYYLRMGYLILRGASRLDAFSVYPFPTWLLCHRLDSLTDTPEVSPSRSSRTKDSSSQISYAHAG